MKRRSVNADEHDVHSPWRHIICSYVNRAGAASRVKRRTRRRERHEAKTAIRRERP